MDQLDFTSAIEGQLSPVNEIENQVAGGANELENQLDFTQAIESQFWP